MRGVPVQMGDKARGACMMRSNASWVMSHRTPPWTDRQTRLKTSPFCNFVGGGNYVSYGVIRALRDS